MPFGDSIAREAIESRSRKGQRRGAVTEQGFRVRPEGAADADLREQGIFADQTGKRILGHMTLSPALTLGG